ncbi:MAG: transcription regulator [Herbinix sp.]|jgi:AraC-like DNA-binding protein|nr:transcription regulator [Herbinix sp.]
MLHLPYSISYDKSNGHGFLQVNNCNHVALQESWLYKERFLNRNEIIYVTGGEIYITIDGYDLSLTEGDILLIPSYKTLDGWKEYEGRTSFYMLGFDCSDDIMAELPRIPVKVKENAIFMGEVFAKLERNFMSKKNTHGRDALLLVILNEMKLCASDGNGTTDLAKKIMEYINENIHSMLTVEQIADIFHYSSDYISKIFREQYDLTIKKYITYKKMNMSKRLLTTTNMSVASVGKSIGFDHEELFVKFFKYNEKVTPKKYRDVNR